MDFETTAKDTYPPMDDIEYYMTQVAVLRKRIAEKDSIIAYWEKNSNENARILAVKDKRIAELERMNKRLKDELKDLIADARWLMG